MRKIYISRIPITILVLMPISQLAIGRNWQIVLQQEGEKDTDK
jgi:hypothetical protein